MASGRQAVITESDDENVLVLYTEIQRLWDEIDRLSALLTESNQPSE
jgi:hypothetical protein